MLSLSQTTGYAILALSCLVEDEDRWVLSKDIAAATHIPGPYLSRVLHALGRSGLIRAKRGYRGGFALTRPASRISLLDVVEAVEGRQWRAPCLLGLTDCAQIRGCPTHAFWKRELARIERELRRTTLARVGAFQGPSAGVLARSGASRGTRTQSGGPRRGRAKRTAKSPRATVTRKPASRRS
ncbi:MAG: RrF2 family transcriptional regulator [Planctomycetota bacterium]|jgi:Rrf2 family protein